MSNSTSSKAMLRKVLAAAILATLPAMPIQAGSLVTASAGIDTIFLDPISSGQDGFVVTVSAPDGSVERTEFGAGETPSIPLDGSRGPLADGTYNYEISVVVAQRFLREDSDDGINSAAADDSTMQSGVFTVLGGEILIPEAGDNGADSDTATFARSGLSPTRRDQVILDDLIVDGSACIGFDCVNGESFGFDTIRIKENNLRIKAQDTSNSASFPTNDWQLTFNDSANGGANKFSVDDIDGGRTPFTIEASAPSNSLYVDDGGRIGLGTSTPVVDLHVVSGNTPTLRLEQNGSSGFTAQTWDVAGNEANFFIRDATNGSTLPFRIRPSAPSSSIDVSASGDVGLGTASPNASLHVRRTDATAKVFVEETNTGSDFLFMMELSNAGTGGIAYRMTTNGLSIDTNNTGGEYRVNIIDGDGQELALTAAGDLTVAGNFISGVTTLNVPDYVFSSEYSLMPMAELATFVAQQKHLPNVPSAAQIEKQGGVNLSTLQMTLLEKIEELTLYTLQQENTLKTLQARLTELEKASD